MAAVYQQSSRPLHHSRLRSTSDPFVDPQQRPSHRPPPPPPKSKRDGAKMPSATPKSAGAQPDNTTWDPAPRSQGESPRTRPSRSQTTAAPPVAPQTSRPSGRRSQSEESSQIVEKPRSSGKSRSKKGGSQHADVIDRLDFTGVGPMFHHDGPFDACAPSRNKHKNAPLYAWSTNPEELRPQYGSGGGAYPSAHAYQAFSNDYPEPPKKKVDAIAEAWGIHEPEPFEEFFAGGGSGKQDGDTPTSSIYNGKDSHRRRLKDDAREGRTRAPRNTTVPPPQPIFVPEANEPTEYPTGSPSNSPGFPKRSKSLMQRIRKMRDSPNVPVSSDYDSPLPPSPSTPNAVEGSTRPTHRTQNSFLGRFGVKGNQSAPPPAAPVEISEPYVFIDNQNSNNQDKALPATPQAGLESPPAENNPNMGYFDAQSQQQQGGAQLGRKTSLMKKVGRVVRGR